ncbi:MAG: TSUP family transporter, partial [Candidatus Limnocylindrus sp.]
ATGGGGWGPVTTPTLLADGRLAPNRVIGTVGASEFVVALSASVGFFASLGGEGVKIEFVFALLAGGLVAAPIAAYMVRHLNPRLLGVIVGGFICFTNARVVMAALDFNEELFFAVYVVILLAWASAIASVVLSMRRSSQGSAEGR